MTDPAPLPGLIRFGIYEVNLRAGELRKNGARIKLQEQPFKVLVMLLEHPGEIVTREELQKALWSTDTFVDFEHGLNKAINKIREALDDSADNPRFVETLARRGYRFIYPVATVSPPAADVGAIHELPLPKTSPRAIHESPLRKRSWLALAAGIIVATLVVLLTLNVAGLREHLLRAVGARHGVPLPKIESIAVLPLENLSGDPEQEYFADGMTEELITTLGKIAALRVISRTTAMHYKGTKKTLPEIARELNVDAVVEGTVLRSGDRVRITANLLYAPADRHLWAETYERDLRNVLALQSDVARAVVLEIRAAMTPEDQMRVARTRQVNPAAYDAYLRAQYHRKKITRQGADKSFEYLQRAIAEDPGYAPAYAALSGAWFARGYGFAAPVAARKAFSEARAAALKAVELDDSLAEAHVSLANVMYEECDWSGAERELKRALELNPGDAGAHVAYGQYLTFKGNNEEAISELNRALELNPLSPGAIVMLTGPYIATRRYDKQIYYYQKALELDPNFAVAHHGLGLAYIRQGKYGEGLREVEKAMALGFGHPFALAVLATGYAKSGQRAKALRILAQLEEQWKHGIAGEAWLVAGAQLDLGNKEQAFVWLEKAYRVREGCSILAESLKMEPEWDPIRSDPRFQDLLRRMNFPP